ncbi:class I SAM-dependent methyltransferase [Spirosoma fluminis]
MNPSDRPWNADLYQQKHAFVFHYGTDVLNLLKPQPGERILDLGCGTGELTAQIALSGADVIGLDASAAMIANARQSFPRLSFQQGDARQFVTDQPFDAVFSNATLHWIDETEQPKVLTNVFTALKAGGRFVAEMGGRGNVERILNAFTHALNGLGIRKAVEINYFPSLGQYARLLETAGFTVTWARFFDRDTPLVDSVTGLTDWLSMFRGDILNDLTDKDRQTVLEAVQEKLRPTNFRDGSWFADYKRLRFIAIKPLKP